MHLSSPYIPPQLLRDLHLLDVLELTGTTQLAGQWLAVSQPTVSRRYRRLAPAAALAPGLTHPAREQGPAAGHRRRRRRP